MKIKLAGVVITTVIVFGATIVKAQQAPKVNNSNCSLSELNSNNRRECIVQPVTNQQQSGTTQTVINASILKQCFKGKGVTSTTVTTHQNEMKSCYQGK